MCIYYIYIYILIYILQQPVSNFYNLTDDDDDDDVDDDDVISGWLK